MSPETGIKKGINYQVVLLLLGFICIGTSLFILLGIFYPVLEAELQYLLRSENEKSLPVVSSNQKKDNAIVPVNEQFGIVIPKIGANAPVIANVDPYNEVEYQSKLSKGVAHAKGSSYPGSAGNTFLFAHSATDFTIASRYNAIFYLINKLEKGDTIFVFYNNTKYEYNVDAIKIVNADEIQYLEDSAPVTDIRSPEDIQKEKLILMTCWPAGTTLKRMLVIAHRTT